MLKLLSSKNPLIVLLYPLISFTFIFFYAKSLNPNLVGQNTPFLYQALLQLIGGKSFSLYYILFAGIFLSADAFLFNIIIRKLKMVNSFQNLHGLIFLLLASTVFSFVDVLQVSLALLLFLLSLFYIFGSLRNDFAVFHFFNAGLALSAASLFWFQIIYFVPMLLFGQIIFRNINLRETLSTFIGLLLPYLFLFSIWFFIQSNFDILFSINQIIMHKEDCCTFNLNFLIFLATFLIILLIALLNILKTYYSAEADKKDYFLFWTLLFIHALVLFFFLKENDTSFTIVVMLAASVCAGIFFDTQKKSRIKEIIFDLLLLAIIFVQFNFFG